MISARDYYPNRLAFADSQPDLEVYICIDLEGVYISKGGIYLMTVIIKLD